MRANIATENNNPKRTIACPVKVSDISSKKYGILKINAKTMSMKINRINNFMTIFELSSKRKSHLIWRIRSVIFKFHEHFIGAKITINFVR
ncbi:MAG: hypothetical protein ACJA08_002095 [Cyclobacteriaceae bacterium]|jgi:hypothetical protein